MKDVAKRGVVRSQRKVDSSEKTTYELQVMFSRYNFSIRWHQIKLVVQSGRRHRLLKTVPQPKSKSGYKRGDFKCAGEWELEIINAYWRSLSTNRMKLKKLGLMHKVLTELTKTEGVEFEHVNIYERVEVNKMSISDYKQQFA